MAYPPVSHHVERPSHLSVLTDPIKFQRVKNLILRKSTTKSFLTSLSHRGERLLSSLFLSLLPLREGIKGRGIFIHTEKDPKTIKSGKCFVMKKDVGVLNVEIYVCMRE